jgi:hypothetical protein
MAIIRLLIAITFACSACLAYSAYRRWRPTKPNAVGWAYAAGGLASASLIWTALAIVSFAK